MTSLEKKLKSGLDREGVGAGSRLLLAVSGGADSVAMLDALWRMNAASGLALTLIVAHLNHCLRGEESDADELFVRDLAAERGLEIIVERAEVLAKPARVEKGNLEAIARRLRYEFLLRAAKKSGSNFVLTAHTRDDQVETILMRMLRGSGAEGLRGIHRRRTLGESVTLLRPLLEVPREDVIAYCAHYRLDYRTDSSNLAIDFTRNKVRQELVPLLRSLNPRSDQAMIRLADLISVDEDYLRRVASELFDRAVAGDALSIDPLIDAHPAVRRRVLRAWLRRQRSDLRQIDAVHLSAIEKLITSGQSGRRIDLPGPCHVLREFNRLVIIDEGMPAQTPATVELAEDEWRKFDDYEFRLRRRPSQPGPLVICLRDDENLQILRLRCRKPGDVYHPQGSRHKIKLKTLMIRHKIPQSQRDTYPLVVTQDDHIVWAPGLPAAREYAAGQSDSHQISIEVRIIREKRNKRK